MSNLFEEVLVDAKGVEKRLLGETYEYWKQIKSPGEIGINSTGTMAQLGDNMDGLYQYLDLLIMGGGRASKPGGPLGNQFFLPTGGKCKDINSCNVFKLDETTGEQVDTGEKIEGCSFKEVDRYIYINNIPQGNIPFLSSGMGQNFSSAKGLIPGSMGNLNALNPFAIMQAFMSGATPDCSAVKLPVRNADNIGGTEKQYLTIVDQSNMDPCNFLDHRNPVNKDQVCKEVFSNMKPLNPSPVLPNNMTVQFYYAILSILGLYILYRLMLRGPK
jgi:hypothetical protein